MLINANYVGWYSLCVTEGRHWSHYMEEYYWVGKLSINCILTRGEQKSWALCLGVLHLECLAKKKTFHSKPCVLFECNLFAIDLLLCSSISYFLFLCVCLHVCILFVVTPSERYITLSFLKIFILCSIYKTSTALCLAAILLSFYSHFSCMSVGVLYGHVPASIEKYFVIHPDRKSVV